MIYQQGDVLFDKVAEIPADVKVVNNPVIAEGELTGHKHQVDLRDVEADKFTMYDKDGILYVKVKKDIKITHQEHKQINLPRGIWKVSKVKEKDHLLDEIREVRD